MMFSQNETDNWYFGENAGLNFSDGLVSTLIDGAMATPAGCSSISDTNGKLLFYTNGQTVWNKNHQVMENGTDLAGDINNTQSCIIIPKPNISNIYYIFTTSDKSSGLSGLFYSEIDISNQNPLGKIISKNIRLSDNVTERITAIHDADTNSIKVITFGSSQINSPKDTFFVYNITANSNNLNIEITRSQQTKEITSTQGAMKISPDGKKIALADFNGNYIYLYNFNITNSEVTYNNTINPNFLTNAFFPYGLEFSQDSKILYYTGKFRSNTSCLYKYILNSNAITI
jgi:hypothetical protein